MFLLTVPCQLLRNRMLSRLRLGGPMKACGWLGSQLSPGQGMHGHAPSPGTAGRARMGMLLPFGSECPRRAMTLHGTSQPLAVLPQSPSRGPVGSGSPIWARGRCGWRNPLHSGSAPRGSICCLPTDCQPLAQCSLRISLCHSSPALVCPLVLRSPTVPWDQAGWL